MVLEFSKCDKIKLPWDLCLGELLISIIQILINISTCKRVNKWYPNRPTN